MTIDPLFVHPHELVINPEIAQALYGGCSLITTADSWHSLVCFAYPQVDSSSESHEFTTHVAASYINLLKLLQRTAHSSWMNSERRLGLLGEVEKGLKRLIDPSYASHHIDQGKLTDLIFNIAMIRGAVSLKDDHTHITDSVMWATYLAKCMKYRHHDFPLRYLELSLPTALSNSTSPTEMTTQSGLTTPPQLTLPSPALELDREQLMVELKRQVISELAPKLSLTSPAPAVIGATHAYRDCDKAMAGLRPPELINFSFNYAPPAAFPGAVNIYGTTTNEQFKLEKVAKNETPLKLVLEEGVTFVRHLTSKQFKWADPAMLPALLLYIHNCFEFTVYASGYQSFLCHPRVLAVDVTTKVAWFFCSLIDFLSKHLSFTGMTQQYLHTPKQPGLYLNYLTQIHASYTNSRFTDPSEDDLVKQVVSHFFSSLSLSEQQKIREVSDFELCERSYCFLRSELERKQITFAAFPKMNATQHHTGNTSEPLGKRKRPERQQAPDPVHSVCSDPTVCDPCKQWVFKLFSFKGFCLRCFGKGHNFYDCYEPVAMKAFRCQFCTKLCCAPFAGTHDNCQAYHKNSKCHCCGDLGHLGSICPSSADKRRAYRLSVKS